MNKPLSENLQNIYRNKVLFVSATEVGISGSFKKKLILGEQPLNTVYVLQTSIYFRQTKWCVHFANAF